MPARFVRFPLAFAFVHTLLGCGGGVPGPPPPPPPAPGVCPTSLDGPQVRIVAGPRPAPPSGGTLRDGTYDLVFIVTDQVPPELANRSDGTRIQLDFFTDRAGADPQEGRVVSRRADPPNVRCSEGRFAVVGSTLRIAARSTSGTGPQNGADDLVGGTSAIGFSVTEDGFVIVPPPPSQRGEPTAMVFRHR